MNLKALSIIFFVLIFSNKINTISVSNSRLKLINSNCFNRSSSTGAELILGQNEPIGLSMEHLISMIEKFEKLNPNFKPVHVIETFLRRFHIDGLQFDGLENMPSDIQVAQAKLINAILGNDDDYSYIENFPEHQFSDDEKCNLFFTLSHTINDTATIDENVFDIIIIDDSPRTRLAAPSNVYSTPRDIGTEIPLSVTDKPKPNIKKNKRSLGNHRTKKPREYGVVSFLSSPTNPISANRVLLGLYVGFANPQKRTVTDVIKSLEKKPLKIANYSMDPLLAVTLADLYGINTRGMAGKIEGKDIFGADGRWNDSYCHTSFKLYSNEGTWATLAEFRGGLDGYNIGAVLPSLLREFPNITASQVLRYYYSKSGLRPNSGICKRRINIEASLKDDLADEARKILTIWNNYHYNNIYDESRINGYIDNLYPTVMQVIEKASYPNEEERKFCEETQTNNIKEQPCETTSNAFFILDISQTNGCDKDHWKCSKQASYVNALTKHMKMSRNSGSISIFYNAKAIENSKLVDDLMKPINTSLYSVAYNTTSSECASCKAIFGDTVAKEMITDRNEMYQQIINMIEAFDKVNENQIGVPSKLIFWFDYGTLKPIPIEAIQNIRYARLSRQLLFATRNSGFYSFTTNTSTLADVVKDPNNLQQIGPNSFANINSLSSLNNRLCRAAPQLFQYPDCKTKTSDNSIYQGYISANHKQYWTMYPEYFLKSYHIEIRFRAVESLIKVCFDRAAFPENNEENCRVNKNIDEDVVLNINNPCKKRTTENCQPFYFTISLYNPTAANKLCKDADCKNIKQFQWYFKHKGISCNNSILIQISSIFMIIFTIFSCTFNI